LSGLIAIFPTQSVSNIILQCPDIANDINGLYPIILSGRFANPQDLLEHAKHFIDRRMSSLKNDVNHCVKIEPCAPYPALIYCFSNIDLLGALYAGKAGKNANTTQQSKNYMKHFMVIMSCKVRFFNVYLDINSFI
jgi:hypothetical protein